MSSEMGARRPSLSVILTVIVLALLWLASSIGAGIYYLVVGGHSRVVVGSAIGLGLVISALLVVALRRTRRALARL